MRLTGGQHALEAATPDPVIAVIEAHRAALDHVDTVKAADESEPGWDVRWDAALNANTEAYRAVVATTPTTAAGFVALARHMQDYLARFAGEPGAWERDAPAPEVTSDDDVEIALRVLFRAAQRVSHNG
jgi:hypothetical protein